MGSLLCFSEERVTPSFVLYLQKRANGFTDSSSLLLLYLFFVIFCELTSSLCTYTGVAQSEIATFELQQQHQNALARCLNQILGKNARFCDFSVERVRQATVFSRVKGKKTARLDDPDLLKGSPFKAI